MTVLKWRELLQLIGEHEQVPQQSTKNSHKFTVEDFNEIHNEVDRIEHLGNNLHTYDHLVVNEMRAKDMEFFNPVGISAEIDAALDTLCNIELIDAEI